MINTLDALAACKMSYEIAPQISGYGIECITVDYQNTHVMAFRGTDSATDAIRDARALPWPSSIGFAHAGFIKAIKCFWPQLVDYLSEHRPDQLALTGHSKGGAEALLVGALLLKQGYSLQKIVTFGAPRCGFPKLGRILRRSTVVELYAHSADPVPRHPWALWGYRHPVQLTRLGPKSPSLDLSSHALASYRKHLI